MIGYKVFYHDLTCRPAPEVRFQYEVGNTYKMDGLLLLCKRGFHFWRFPHDVFNLHTASFDARVCEIEATGEIVNDYAKYATNCITIVHELHPAEIVDAMVASAVLNHASQDLVFCLMKDVAHWVRVYLDLGGDFMLTGTEFVRALPSEQRAFIDDRAHEWESVLEAKGYEV